MRIEFLDWDDRVVGALVLPKHIRGYPKLSKMEYARLRTRKVNEFRRDHPRQRYYVEERHLPVIRDGRITVEIDLEVIPSGYIPMTCTSAGFRTTKEV